MHEERPPVIVIGASLGGLSAIPVILGGLPRDFPSPLVIVQHRAILSDDAGLVEALQRGCPLAVREVEDKDRLAPGRVHLAPADYHLLIEGDHLTLSTEARVLHARPSIDVLFDSAAESHAGRVVAVVLTGASRDGVIGAQRVKQRGGTVIVQDPAGAECKVMPSAAIAGVAVDRVLPLDQIAPYLVRCGLASSR